MNSLIYLEVTHQINFSYQKEFLSLSKEALPDIEIFDLDNYSEPALFTYAMDLIRKSDKCSLVLKVEKDAPVGKIMILLEEVLKNKEKTFVILNGENKFIERMMKQLTHYAMEQNEQEILKLLRNFLKSGSNAQ